MDLKNWRENIARVKGMNFSRYVIIPFVMANSMGIEAGDYVKLEYNEEEKSIKIMKN